MVAAILKKLLKNLEVPMTKQSDDPYLHEGQEP